MAVAWTFRPSSPLRRGGDRRGASGTCGIGEPSRCLQRDVEGCLVATPLLANGLTTVRALSGAKRGLDFLTKFLALSAKKFRGSIS